MASVFPDNRDKDKAIEKTKGVIEELLGDVSKTSAAKQLALGSATGWVTGFLTMKVGKMVAIAVGGGIICIQIAQHKGYIRIDWDKLQKQADKVADRIEKETTGKGPNMIDKLERYVDRKLDKAEDLLKSRQRKARSWYHAFINNGEDGYQLQELHIFMASFAAGIALGFATG